MTRFVHEIQADETSELAGRHIKAINPQRSSRVTVNGLFKQRIKSLAVGAGS
jgi:hypothetical protein